MLSRAAVQKDISCVYKQLKLYTKNNLPASAHNMALF
jgi:hypothetical protein